MKIFILNAFAKYKNYSKQLDAKSILTQKSWQVFNNTGEKEIFIFQEDGSLIISLNGKAIIAKWSFITANDTVLITVSEQSYMMKPFFNDDNLFVLQMDGTEEYSFLIDETKKASFPATSLTQLESHIKNKAEKKIIQEAEAKRQRLLQEQRNRDIAEELEQKRVQVENIKKEIDNLWIANRDRILKNSDEYVKLVSKDEKSTKRLERGWCLLALGILIPGLTSEFFEVMGRPNDFPSDVIYIGLLFIPIGLLTMLSGYRDYGKKIQELENKLEKKYKSQLK